MSDLIALRAVFPVWDAVGHGTERYPHDLNGVVRVPREAAVHLLHNGGYVIHDPAVAPAQDDGIPSLIHDLTVITSPLGPGHGGCG
ncbi:MAG TPA: hypothetical protein VJX94_15670 [Stellaceae bacterium]|nr:hypothetical protein [Stellaceae bacterium]